MHVQRYKSSVTPSLLSSLESASIVGDVFPSQITPTSCVEVNYKGYGWLGAYGHGIPPEDTLSSPQIDILTDHTDEKLYSLMLLDLDRANPLEKRYEQWAHWYMYVVSPCLPWLIF